MIGVIIVVLIILLCCWCCGCCSIFSKKPLPQKTNPLPLSTLKPEYTKKTNQIQSYTIPIKYTSISSECIDSTISRTISSYEDDISNPETSNTDFRYEQKVKYVSLGKFKCHQCNRHWASVRADEERFQKCKNCKNKIYPYSVKTVKSREENRIPTSPHLKDLCEMCTLYGNCRLIKTNFY